MDEWNQNPSSAETHPWGAAGVARVRFWFWAFFFLATGTINLVVAMFYVLTGTLGPWTTSYDLLGIPLAYGGWSAVVLAPCLLTLGGWLLSKAVRLTWPR